MKAFGSVQITYCQVGRQLSELFAAQDSTVPAEHIQPARYFSANTGLWFGPDLGLSFETQYVESIRLWYMQNRAKFEAADIFWDSADRALGTVTVAQLNRKFISLDERKLFQQTLSRFDRVLSVIC